MRNQKITTRRRATPKKNRILRAVTQKEPVKKIRAVASSPAAGFNDVDQRLSSKIITGLFVLLLLHVFAVAAIVVHSKFNKDNIAKVKTEKAKGSHLASKGAYELYRQEQKGRPKISTTESYTWVNPGDTYQSIADRIKCDVDELKRYNQHKPLKAGRAIKTPIRKIKVISPEVEAIGRAAKPTIEEVQPDVHRIVINKTPSTSNSKPVLSKFKKGYISHTFKNNETFWALSRKYNVSVSAIQRANPQIKPTSIQEGTLIRIPR